MPINCNVKDYIDYLLNSKKLKLRKESVSSWRTRLINLKNKYPISKELKNKHKNYASSFKFVDDLCNILKDDEIVNDEQELVLLVLCKHFRQKIISVFGHQVDLRQWVMDYPQLLGRA